MAAINTFMQLFIIGQFYLQRKRLTNGNLCLFHRWKLVNAHAKNVDNAQRLDQLDVWLALPVAELWGYTARSNTVTKLATNIVLRTSALAQSWMRLDNIINARQQTVYLRYHFMPDGNLSKLLSSLELAPGGYSANYSI